MWIEICGDIVMKGCHAVTPYAGVWIEIWCISASSVLISVTPYAGVWIEIKGKIGAALFKLSLPTRECGLK